jgi:hypothetical protein
VSHFGLVVLVKAIPLRYLLSSGVGSTSCAKGMSYMHLGSGFVVTQSSVAQAPTAFAARLDSILP